MHRLFPRAAEKVYLLREFEPGATSLDVADPIAMGFEAYRAARDIILNGLPGLMQFIDQDEFIIHVERRGTRKDRRSKGERIVDNTSPKIPVRDFVSSCVYHGHKTASMP